MPRIDAHTHVWSLDADRYPWQVIAPASGIPATPSLPEDLLSAMDAAGVDGCLAVQPSTYGWNNSYLFHAVEQHPSTFLGVALVDPADLRAADTLRALGHHRGIRAVRFHVLEDGAADLFFQRAECLAEAAAAVDLVITLQIKPPYLVRLPQILRRVPSVRVVIDHMGLVRPSEGSDGLRPLLDLSRYEQVTIKVSGGEALSEQAYPFLDCRPIATALLESFGVGRLMWASNYPHVLRACTYEQVAGLLEHWLPDLSTTEAREIEGGTAARVFRAAGLGPRPALNIG